MGPALTAVTTGRRPLCAVCALAVSRLGAARIRRQVSTGTTGTTGLTRTSGATGLLTRPAASVRVRSSCGAAKQWRPLLRSQALSTASEGGSTARKQEQGETLPFYALFATSVPEGPPPRGPFAVDVRALRREFLRLQAAAHPDFHHAAGGEAGEAETKRASGHSVARARAEAASARINEAYRTLASPLLRAQYLLRERFGIDLAGDESTLGGGDGDGAAAGSMDLLMAVLEAREDIEAATSEADLVPLRTTNEARMRASEAALAEAFAADDGTAARSEAVRLRYWTNIEETLREWEPGKEVVLQH